MKKIVITGGAGFIGSHIVDHFARHYPNAKITVFDKMTYAADIHNIMPLIETDRIELIVGDVCDLQKCYTLLKDCDLLIHAAAESHVDNSFGNSLEFSRTNVLGTHALMEAALKSSVPKIIHVSTDEVYGEVIEGRVDESAHLLPTNPYSASKAAADMVIQGYKKSFHLPVITVRSNNIFGIRQFPEKIIPKFLLLMMMGQKLPLHGTGQNMRHFLAAQDLCQALDILVQKGEIGQIYNIGTMDEYKNIEVAEMICALFDQNPKEAITYIDDRPFNDARYAITWEPLKALGWKPAIHLRDQLPDMARWYYDNFDRFAKNGEERINAPKLQKAA
ncbi:MAG: dTDP-glucose 4,6-dehydratase [Micavibrio sp.]|nr:dTDP-glucose 4,6-dehydratase [Micavibrio sp.]|tara:strand:- start:7431 stop:8429 length:999 start_codon:yes stop_codon:yes gene_type:complete